MGIESALDRNGDLFHLGLLEKIVISFWFHSGNQKHSEPHYIDRLK